MLILTANSISAQTLDLAWAKKMGGFGTDVGTSVKVDVAGNIYTVGNFTNTADFDPSTGTFNLTAFGNSDVFVSKLDPSGNFIWAKQLGGTDQDIGFRISIDNNDNLLISGAFNSTADFDPGAGIFNLTSLGGFDMFICKLDPNGNFIWAKQLGSPLNEASPYLSSDLNGNVYLSGHFYDTFDFDPGPGVYNLTTFGNNADVFEAKLDASGNFIWAKQLGGVNGEFPSSFFIDANSNIYTIGYFSGTADFDPGPGVYNLTTIFNASDVFISKLDASGNFIWAKQLAGSSIPSFGGGISALIVEAGGNILITGTFNGTIDFDPGPGVFNLSSSTFNETFILKLDGTGNFNWARHIATAQGTPSSGLSTNRSISTDAAGNIFTLAGFVNTVDFDPGPGVYNLTSFGGWDIFISILDNVGNFIGAKQIGGTGDDFVNSLSTDVNRNFYATGAFSSIADFDPCPGNYNLTSSGSYDIYVAKFSSPIVSITASSTTICSGTSVTFTATPTNGGLTPSYQWQVNGVNVGTNSPTYITTTLNNNDQVRVILTSNASCVPPTIANSNVITVTVNANVSSSVSISTPITTICPGASITFTATPTNGGPSPTYQWQVNGSNVGTNSPTYTTNTLTNGDLVKVIMTSSAVCATPPSATSNSIAITVSPGGPAQVSISSTGSTICLGASVTFTATPTNGGPSPTYQWQVNGSNVGTNSPTYTTNTLTNGDLVKVIMTSSLTCAIGSPATSNTITMVVNSNITPAVALVASPNGAICAGTSVTFTATAINTGGGNVTYDFKVNGGSVQNSTLNTYTTVTLTNGNIVTCDITVSAGACLTSTTATSNTITMTVNPSFTPVVSLSASPNTTICAGTLVTFTATASNLGSSSVSTYDFKVNGVSQQSGISNTYTTTSLVNTDIVTCIITVIGGNCITSSTALSNMIIMTVNTNITPTVNIIAFPSGPICVGTSVSFTATASNLGGGSVSIYDFKVNGVSQQTGASNTYATTSLINNDVVTCTITITGGICLTSTTVSSNTITMIVNSSVTPTVAITPSPTGPICAGTSVTFTATASDLGGGSVSTYDFKVNGISQQAGASNNYPTTSLFNGDVVTCTITIIGSGCLTSTTAISNTITMLVNTNVIPSVAITSTPSGAICAGTNVTFTATPTNGGSTPAYQWQVNGVNVGTNSPVYTTNSLNSSDVIKCILTSNYICLTTATVSSNTITMTVNSPVIPSISIGTSANNICTGTLVTFTATPVNGGVSPSYQWKINGINVGSNSPAYSTTGILNGDIVSCVLTNPNSCSTTNTANSNDITMIVTATIIPTLSIVSSANDICPSTPITFTAMPANAGTPPSFQWKLNGADVGTNSIAYINNDLLNGDKISCIMNTVTSCSSSPLVYSDTITMIIKPVPTISFNPAAPAIFHGGSIQLNATIAGSISSYLWTPSTGLSNSTILNPIANPSVTTVYNLNAVAVNGCFVDKQLTVKVFTEIYIPNSFTPNGDGINDIFRIPPGTSLTLQYFIIYDRYGNEILKTNDINKGWDGTYKGKKSPTGVYTYLIKGVDSRSKVLLNGTVILIH